jgi:hypothetical protein
VIFSNIEALVPVNEGILDILEKRQSPNSIIEKVGDVFLEKVLFLNRSLLHIKPFFFNLSDLLVQSTLLKLYAVYCSNQTILTSTLAKWEQENKAFAQFLKDCSLKPECRAMLLADFLIQPLQRICKYPLLLRVSFLF